MSDKSAVLILGWTPDGALPRLAAEFPALEFFDVRQPADLDRLLGRAVITYGAAAALRLAKARLLRWVQLYSAGVPQELCPVAKRQAVTVTNLAGLYGPSIAEHALALIVMLARNLHVVVRQQHAWQWQRDVAKTMIDLRGRTLGIVGLGNIGQSIGRLARAYGMRVVGCRRTGRPAANVDEVYPLVQLHTMLAEADFLAVAAPLTAQTEGMLGPAEFRAMKRGVFYVNVSRGGIAQEPALLDALHSGQVAGAGLDVFAVEPLPADHALWSMPNVIVSPHYSGETVNQSSLPIVRFARNLRAWSNQGVLEGVVDLDLGY